MKHLSTSGKSQMQLFHSWATGLQKQMLPTLKPDLFNFIQLTLFIFHIFLNFFFYKNLFYLIKNQTYFNYKLQLIKDIKTDQKIP